MAKEEKKQIISQEDVMNILNSCYEKCLNGIPKTSPSVEDFANEYLNKYKTPEIACDMMLKNQITKCTTSGFITGFGGFIAMPVTIPANLSSVLYVQMRMIACAAYMAGYELSSDETQTFVYACLAGVAVNGVVKKVATQLYVQMRMIACAAYMAGYELSSDETQTFVYACLAGVAVNGVVKKVATQFGQKVATNLIKKIPGTVLQKINQRVGFRFLTKFGSKGLINFGKLIPGVGAITGGALDFVETRAIAKRAYKWFFENDFSVEKSKEDADDEEIIIDMDETILN